MCVTNLEFREELTKALEKKNRQIFDWAIPDKNRILEKNLLKVVQYQNLLAKCCT